MRSLFLEGFPTSERSELDRFDTSCQEFFDALRGPPLPTLEELSDRLTQLDPEFELVKFQHAPSGGVTLEVRASDTVAKPRLQRFATLAPNSMRVVSDPGPRPLEEVSAAVQDQTGRSLDGARVRAGFSRGHLLDLVVYLRETSNRDDPDSISAAEGAVYGLLGEQRADDWIGRIDVAPLPRGGPLKLVGGTTQVERTFELGELAVTVENAVRGLYEGMRSSTAGNDGGEWTLLEAGPAEGTNLPGQDDLIYASTPHPEMLKCFLEGAPFSSCRFSESGERFCYLEFRHGGSAEARAAERQNLEDAIESALALRRLGRVVGNGLGTEHSYIDMAVGDVPKALDTLRELCQELALPRASWIRFFDSEWRREWVGIWSDSPPPKTR